MIFGCPEVLVKSHFCLVFIDPAIHLYLADSIYNCLAFLEGEIKYGRWLMTAASPMKKLVGRLSRSGFSAAFIKEVTPAWWDKSLEGSEQSMLLLKMHFAKNLGLELSST